MNKFKAVGLSSFCASCSLSFLSITVKFYLKNLVFFLTKFLFPILYLLNFMLAKLSIIQAIIYF